MHLLSIFLLVFTLPFYLQVIIFSKRIWMSYYNPFPQHSHKIILISLILLCARNVKILTLHRNVRISYLNSIYIMHIELIAFKHPKT